LTVTAKLTGPPGTDASVIQESWAEPERFAAGGSLAASAISQVTFPKIRGHISIVRPPDCLPTHIVLAYIETSTP
jgi:hypothetical protein